VGIGKGLPAFADYYVQGAAIMLIVLVTGGPVPAKRSLLLVALLSFVGIVFMNLHWRSALEWTKVGDPYV
jgi:hypothetical protein